MDNPLNGGEIKYLLNNKIKILTYDQLKNYKNIESLLYPFNRVIILYVWKKSENMRHVHWIGVHVNNRNNIEVFDSFGNFVDDFLNKIDVKFRNENGQSYRYLTDLLLKHRGTIEYNEKKLQNDKSNTCGKWVIYRFLRNDLTLEQFQNLFSKNTQRNDNIILKLFS